MSAIKKTVRPKPVVLITLEGWGIAPAHPGNALTEANPPYFNHLISHYPALALKSAVTSESGVNSPASSELSHLTIGLGRPVINICSQIDEAIVNGSFKTLFDGVLKEAAHHRLHIIGLISNGNSESSLNHLTAIINLLQKKPHQEVFFHAILDGRDMSAKGGQKLLAQVEKDLAVIGGVVATVTGRLYALDLHQHENRLQKTVSALRAGQGNKARSSSEAIKESYEKKIYDEEFSPTVIINERDEAIGPIADNDLIVFLNFDSLAIGPLAKMLVNSFQKQPVVFSLGDYQLEEKINPLFHLTLPTNTLGEVISQASYRQLRISDSEGFAAVSAFLNGGSEQELPGEDRRLVSAPLMETYISEPSFSNEELTKQTIKAIEENKYDFIALHFSNIDRVAQSGDLAATIAAVLSVDTALNKIVTAILETAGVAIITGSHGLAEQLSESSEKTFSSHTKNLVPFILVGKQFAGYSLGLPEAVGGDLSILSPAGSLIDIAPTILKLMRLAIPAEMTGQSFFDELRLV